MICANTEAMHRYDREGSAATMEWERQQEAGWYEGNCSRAQVQALVNYARERNEDLFDIAIEQLEASDPVWLCALNNYCVDTFPHDSDQVIEEYAEKYAELKM